MSPSSSPSNDELRVTPETHASPASYRDPDGFAFQEQGRWYRAVTARGLGVLEHLERSGLYSELTDQGCLISHEIESQRRVPGAVRVLCPEQVPFLSYASEWGFEQLKDAARLTLSIHARALSRGAWMADAATSNIQFFHGAPRLIDTLSVKPLRDGVPWLAYRQFCEQFLAPLALASSLGAPALALLRAFPEGVPLPLVSRLLPLKSWLRPALLLHLHAHALAIQRAAKFAAGARPAHRPVSLAALKGLAHSLTGCVEQLRARSAGAPWLGYYENDLLTPRYLEHKEKAVLSWLGTLASKRVWDAGANTGHFSRLTARAGASVIALEADAECVDRIYVDCCREARLDVLPLVIDLAQPTPPAGWNLRERRALTDRGHPDVVLALALTHHLALGRNLPLPMVAEFFGQLAPHLIIEFVPKTDPNARRLLACREDIFPHYDQSGFEAAFGARYTIESRQPLEGTERWLYLMKRKQG